MNHLQSTADPLHERWWQAFVDKDPAYEGEFVVAVRTTGVYCRPTCFARPLRKNVEFFAHLEEARSAGYRACLRCHPDQALSPHQELVSRACQWIDREGHARLQPLGAAFNLSPFHLQRIFKSTLGVSPAEYARSRRVENLKGHLKAGARVTDAALDAGFSGSNRLDEGANELGMSARAYRSGGRGTTIGYQVVDTALGQLLVAGTERGLSAVFLGDDQAALEDALGREYPEATRTLSQDQQIKEWTNIVQGCLEGQVSEAALQTLPLDVQSTVFQARVWQALRSIERGSTRSYADIARTLGAPNATRAVARACSQNRLALVVPCHRVVRSDGSPSGYRWGAERKVRLLSDEALPGEVFK